MNTTRPNTEMLAQDQQVWSLAAKDGSGWTGPFSVRELREKASDGEIATSSLVWRQGLEAWTQAGSLVELRSVFSVGTEGPMIRSSSRANSEGAKVTLGQYHVYKNGQKIGPLELEDVLSLGLNAQDLIWKPGLSSWVSANELKELASGSGIVGAGSTERRAFLRKSLNARVALTNQRMATLGSSLDLSLGGMRVKAENLEAISVGSKIRVNITAQGELPAFVAEAEVVRTSESGDLSFRFVKLDEKARNAIESFVAKAA